MALVATLVAYDGWSNLSFVNGEVIKPQRTLPRAVAIGVGVAMAVYLLTNIAYLRVLTPAAIAGAERVGSDVAQRAMGAAGATFLSITVLISMLGASNGTVMTAPRLYFAQALDGLFFRRFATVHPKYQTPSVSVVAQGIWGALLAASGSYELIINYAIFCAWAFYAMVVIGLMILRRSQPDVKRPYRLWGYPVTPLLFVGVAVLVLVNSIITTPLPSLSGLGIILAGIPVYFYWRRHHAVRLSASEREMR
jgi:APA family basic amino acid/polyamine antiporter